MKKRGWLDGIITYGEQVLTVPNGFHDAKKKLEKRKLKSQLSNGNPLTYRRAHRIDPDSDGRPSQRRGRMPKPGRASRSKEDGHSDQNKNRGEA